MPALIPAYIQWVTSDNPLTHTNAHTHAAATDLASSLWQHLISASLQSLFSPPSPVPAQYSYWSRSMAHAPPCSHTPSLPAALRTHTTAQVRWLITHRGHPCSDSPHLTLFVGYTFSLIHFIRLLVCLCVLHTSIILCVHDPPSPCHTQAFSCGDESCAQSSFCPGTTQQPITRIHKCGLQG